VSKLLRNGSSGVEEKEEKENEGNELFFLLLTLCRQLNLDEEKNRC
jgi:hypothetical protein